MTWQISSNDALVFAVRMVCIGRLVATVEFTITRSEFGPGGLINWGIIQLDRPLPNTFIGARLCRYLDLLLERPCIFSVVASTDFYGHPRLALPAHRYPALSITVTWALLLWECTFPLCLVAPERVLLAMMVVGVTFHLSCGYAMGLNSFLWPFAANYLAVIFVNQWLAYSLPATFHVIVTLILAVAIVALLTLVIRRGVSQPKGEDYRKVFETSGLQLKRSSKGVGIQ
jgi:hypothetical protein